MSPSRRGGVTEQAADATVDQACRLLRLPMMRARFAQVADGRVDFDYPGFVHTVLVDTRARLAASNRPDRIFQVTLVAARRAGFMGRRRVLDSTSVYDAVATMDTVTLIRSAIRGLLRAADGDRDRPELGGGLRAVLERDDDYGRGQAGL